MRVSTTGEKDHRPPLLSGSGKLILGSVFLNSIPIGYMNVLPLVYLLKIGFNPLTIGTIYAASAVANTVGYTPFGVLADRYGRKKFMILGSVLPVFSYAIFGLTVDPYLLTIASVIGGIGVAGGLAVAMSSTALLPLLAESTSDEQRTAVYGILEGTLTVALSIGSFSSFLPGIFASVFLQREGPAHSESYFVMAVIMAASIIPLLFLKERPRRAEASPDPLLLPLGGTSGSSIPPRISVSSWSRVGKFSLVFLLLGLGFGTLVQLLPTWYSLRFGVSESTVGLWTGFAQIVTLVAIPLIPLLVRKKGTVIASAATGMAASIPFALIPLSGSFEVAAGLYVARSVLATVAVVILQSYVIGAVSERERATTIGIAFTAWGVANSIGTAIAGGLLATNLLFLPFVVGTAAYLGSSVTFLLFFRRFPGRN